MGFEGSFPHADMHVRLTWSLVLPNNLDIIFNSQNRSVVTILVFDIEKTALVVGIFNKMNWMFSVSPAAL